MVKLKELSIRRIPITTIPHLKNLKQLTRLTLAGCQLKNISALTGLTKLTKLDVSYNKIEAIPLPLLRQFDKLLDRNFSYAPAGLRFDGNPITEPPPEIVEQGREAMIRYFERKEKEEFSPVQEAKLIFVGEGAAGKTSLKLRLQDPGADLPKEEERTRGIDVTRWEFEKNIFAHIWDFGGQDVYYPVHRFFITDNSVFVLLATTRHQQHNFEYWIPTIFQFGGNSPILIGQTCHDGNTEHWNDLSNYTSNNNFHIVKNNSDVAFYRVNLKSGNQGLDEIKRDIIHQIKKLPHLSKSIPKSWVDVRDELGKNSDMCITYAEFEKICAAVSPSSFAKTEDFSDCCLFLHNIGSLFWYHKNPKLRNWVVLKPELAVEAVYKIIDDPEIKNRLGHIVPADFTRLWADKHLINYHTTLKEMLNQFRVAFPKRGNDEAFI